jgi:hypothetical protein
MGFDLVNLGEHCKKMPVFGSAGWPAAAHGAVAGGVLIRDADNHVKVSTGLWRHVGQLMEALFIAVLPQAR